MRTVTRRRTATVRPKTVQTDDATSAYEPLNAVDLAKPGTDPDGRATQTAVRELLDAAVQVHRELMDHEPSTSGSPGHRRGLALAGAHLLEDRLEHRTGGRLRYVMLAACVFRQIGDRGIWTPAVGCECGALRPILRAKALGCL